jgi:hypothetical protein
MLLPFIGKLHELMSSFLFRYVSDSLTFPALRPSIYDMQEERKDDSDLSHLHVSDQGQEPVQHAAALEQQERKLCPINELT